jgi:hypothetical protein
MTEKQHVIRFSSLSLPLKDSARLSLLLVLIANAAAFYGVIKTATMAPDTLLQLTNDWSKLLPAGAGFVLTSVLNEVLDPIAKARLVFWRWRDPLPGSQAFTEYASSDPRINQTALKRAYRPLPTEPVAQNALWYRLYKSIECHPAVVQVHRKYLFTRDYTAASALILLILGPVGVWAISYTYTALLYFALLVLQYILVRQAAKNNGIRFVTTVIAIKSAE